MDVKMSRRPILSRPRTRVYNANYDIGQSYYKSALDRLDRKYSGRALSPPARNPQVSQDILERHQRAFTDDDLPSARRRAEQHITEDNPFDLATTRPRRPLSVAFEAEDEFDDEISSTLRNLRARRSAARVIDDVDLENTCNNISFNRMINRTGGLLDSVGLNEKSARNILGGEEEPAVSSIRRRVLKMTASSEDSSDSRDMTKWSSLNSATSAIRARESREEESSTSAAAFRARASRARLQDLEDEMEQLNERQIARERRAANLKAIIAENAEETEAMDHAIKSVHARVQKKALAY